MIADKTGIKTTDGGLVADISFVWDIQLDGVAPLVHMECPLRTQHSFQNSGLSPKPLRMAG